VKYEKHLGNKKVKCLFGNLEAESMIILKRILKNYGVMPYCFV
jgi:hypothetical protein